MIFRIALFLSIALCSVASAATPAEVKRLIAQVKANGEPKSDDSGASSTFILHVDRGARGGYQVTCCLQDSRLLLFIFPDAERYSLRTGWLAVIVNPLGQSNERWWHTDVPKEEWFVPYDQNMQKVWQQRTDTAIRDILRRK